jgi:hypothetical protein
MQGVEFIFNQVQGKGHLLVVELSLDRDLLMRGQASQQILDLHAAIDHQAAGFVAQVQRGVVLHFLNELQFIRREEIVALHGQARLTGYWGRRQIVRALVATVRQLSNVNPSGFASPAELAPV